MFILIASAVLLASAFTKQIYKKHARRQKEPEFLQFVTL